MRHLLFTAAFGLVLFLIVPTGRGEDGPRHVALDPEDKSFSINCQNSRVEPMEGGGIRVIYTNPDLSTKRWLNFVKTFDTPVKVSRVGFELKVAMTEGPVVGVRWTDGKGLSKTLQSMGASLSEYELDFQSLASEKNENTDAEAERINITLWVSSEPGEHTVELKNWWFE